jgi:hypothetical protein
LRQFDCWKGYRQRAILNLPLQQGPPGEQGSDSLPVSTDSNIDHRFGICQRLAPHAFPGAGPDDFREAPQAQRIVDTDRNDHFAIIARRHDIDVGFVAARQDMNPHVFHSATFASITVLVIGIARLFVSAESVALRVQQIGVLEQEEEDGVERSGRRRLRKHDHLEDVKERLEAG